MNIRELRTMVALAEHGSFMAAGRSVGLTHSAISLHVKSLETKLGKALVDRRYKPPRLTDTGHALVERARAMIAIMDEIDGLGSADRLKGSLAIGVVPSAQIDLLPPALSRLRVSNPDLGLRIKSGLSGELASQLRHGDLDVAILTAPDARLSGLSMRIVREEPLYLIHEGGLSPGGIDALLALHPFIWFNRKAWAGQQIEQHLERLGRMPTAAMEADSIEAVTALVRAGLGISVVPLAANRKQALDGLEAIPFGEPQAVRTLVLAERADNPRRRLSDALLEALLAESGAF